MQERSQGGKLLGARKTQCVPGIISAWCAWRQLIGSNEPGQPFQPTDSVQEAKSSLRFFIQELLTRKQQYLLDSESSCPGATLSPEVHAGLGVPSSSDFFSFVTFSCVITWSCPLRGAYLFHLYRSAFGGHGHF